MRSLNSVLVGIILMFELCSAKPMTDNKPDDLIVGGFETTIEDNPWQVSLRYFSSHRCGGSIISDRWILTAAHCTNNLPANALDVRVGTSTYASGGFLLRLKGYVQNPEFDSSLIDFDYSLLELAEPLKFSKQIQPIALPDADTKVADGALCRVSGWGNTQNSSESKEHLRAANVPIVNQKQCIKQYKGVTSITPRMICAGLLEGGKDSCQGDSGGPLLEENNGKPRLVGVVSFGYGCAEPNYPGVYSRVTAGRKWIQSVTGI